MQIGEIAGGVTSLQAPSRRAPSAALAVRDDGWVAIIDVRAESANRVRWAWHAKNKPAAACAGWMTAEVPLIVTHEGRVITVDRSKVRSGVLAEIGYEDCGRSTCPVHVGVVTRQQYPASGPPFAITADEQGAYWWGVTETIEPVADGYYPWPTENRQVRREGVMLPWVNANGFIKLVAGGAFVTLYLVTKRPPNPVLNVEVVGTVRTGEGQEFRVVGGLPAAGGVGIDVCLACPDRLRLARVRSGREIETVEVLSAEEGRTITSADFRNGLGVVSSTYPGGGSVDVFDPATGRRLQQYHDLDVGVQDVVLLHDGRRTRALAVDTDGGVHLWTVGRDADTQGSAPLSPQPSDGAVAIRGIDLD